MNETFCTSDFDTLCAYIKPLLDESHGLRINIDCGGVYMVDHHLPYEHTGERFLLYSEEDDILEGHKICFVYDDEEEE